ncbi:MAG TPA: 50S ribosomal protein L10 [Clostridiaceae bacterium]|nr:50S ribosomal protein L10 [Clostridiaceae bacterium]
MPNAKVLEQKKAIVQSLADKFKNATSGVFVDFKGINVADDTKLRADMRAANVDYSVYKNTMIRLAAKEAGIEGLEPYLAGTTAIAISDTDVVAPAKIITDYVKKIQGKFEVKVGFVEGELVDAKQVEAIAALPSKEVLIATALAGLNAPITGFVNVLNANLRGLVIALNAICEKKESEAA